LGKQDIDRDEFIAEFIQSHKDGTFDNAKAKAMAKRCLAFALRSGCSHGGGRLIRSVRCLS